MRSCREEGPCEGGRGWKGKDGAHLAHIVLVLQVDGSVEVRDLSGGGPQQAVGGKEGRRKNGRGRGGRRGEGGVVRRDEKRRDE